MKKDDSICVKDSAIPNEVTIVRGNAANARRLYIHAPGALSFRADARDRDSISTIAVLCPDARGRPALARK